MLEFRETVAGRVRSRFPRAAASQLAMVLVDGTLIVLAIRFVGITPAQLPALSVLSAFLVAYPLTLFFFSGLGLLDTAVLTTLLVHVGVDHGLEPDLVAAFLVWRAITILTPLALGAVSVLLWKVEQLRR